MYRDEMQARAILPMVPILFASIAQAQLSVSSIFSDHAVLQRDRPITIWGTASPAAIVTLQLGSTTAETVAEPSGKWRVMIDPQPASDAPQSLIVRSGEAILERTDILFGDVWHASGQSNMGMTLAAVMKSYPDIEERIGSYEQREIRFFKIGDGPSRVPQDAIESAPKWTECDDDNVRSFSAVAFIFAAKVNAEVGVPIGVIDSSRGGTPIEPFIPLSAFDKHPTLRREKELGDRDDLEGIARLRGGVRARSNVWLPGRLFNSRLAPIANYPFAGAIWYQGESNSGIKEDPRDYEHKMRALVSGWRNEFRHPEMPFYFVQLPGFSRGTNWPYLREQQRLASAIVNSGMVVTIDLEDPDIHPPNKLDVGHRLANYALAKHYRRNVPCNGPMFENATIRKNKVVVKFSHADSGLMIAHKQGLEPPIEQINSAPQHFEITADGVTWLAANAEIENQTVVVSNEGIEFPIAVRYAYAPAPSNGYLYNREGLPASPFCSQPELLDGEPE